MAKRTFNRASVDVGNILAMEHVNVTVPDQGLATFFYINGLGFTRDPYIDWGPYNVWINVGRQQFHLPTAKPQVLRGHTGVCVPSLPALNERLARVSKRLSDTKFGYTKRKNYTDVTCPWGNQIKCFGPEAGVATMQLGIPYVEFKVPTGTTAGIARFYDQVLDAPTSTGKGQCEVMIGQEQKLRFREAKNTNPEYDGHHIAIYISNFSGPHEKLVKAGLISEESDANQYRFQSIVDPDNGKLLFEIEHEVRSLFHPMWERQLVNRNADQSFFNYQRDRDVFTPSDISTR